MTSNTKQLRAVFLATLMVVSVFAGTVAFAVSAGVATFLAPCAYPLLPGYVGYYLSQEDADVVGSRMVLKLFRDIPLVDLEALLRDGAPADPDRLAELFVEVTDDLSYAQTFYPGSKTTRYLNGLAAEVHRPVDEAAVTVSYGGRPRIAPNPPWDGGFTWARTADGQPWIATSCQSVGADVWWPVKDHPSDEPDSMALHITVPEPLVVASNGRLRGVEEAGTGLVAAVADVFGRVRESRPDLGRRVAGVDQEAGRPVSRRTTRPDGGETADTLPRSP